MTKDHWRSAKVKLVPWSRVILIFRSDVDIVVVHMWIYLTYAVTENIYGWENVLKCHYRKNAENSSHRNLEHEICTWMNQHELRKIFQILSRLCHLSSPFVTFFYCPFILLTSPFYNIENFWSQNYEIKTKWWINYMIRLILIGP